MYPARVLSWPDPGEEKRKVHRVIRDTLGGRRERGFLLTSCIFMWCIVMRYPLPQHGKDKKHKVCTKTHITARQRAPHRELTTNDFQDLYFLVPPPSPHSHWPPLVQDRQLGKTSQTNYGNIKCGMNNFCKIWEDGTMELELETDLLGLVTCN